MQIVALPSIIIFSTQQIESLLLEKDAENEESAKVKEIPTSAYIFNLQKNYKKIFFMFLFTSKL